jgi:tetratricopeptide (TPR) repeat protein
MLECDHVSPEKSTNVRLLIAAVTGAVACVVLVLPVAAQQPAMVQDTFTSWRVREHEADRLLREGALRAGQGQWHDARRLFEAAIRLSPSAALYYNLGVTLAALGDADRAVRAYADALRLDPSLVEARVNIGVELSHAGRPTEALDHLERATRRAPRMVATHHNLGLVLAQLGRLDASIASLTRAFALDPDDTVVRRALADAQYNSGVHFARRRLWKEAIGRYRAALAIDRGFADSFNGIGVALGRLDNHEGALEMYDEAVRLRPSFVEARYNLAISYTALARYADAIRSCRAILSGRPDFARARALLRSLENGDASVRLSANASIASEPIAMTR